MEPPVLKALPGFLRRLLARRETTLNLVYAMVVAADVFSFVAAMYLGWWLRFGSGWFAGYDDMPSLKRAGSVFTEYPEYAYLMGGVVMLPIWLATYMSFSLYDEYRTRKPINEILGIVKASGVGLILIMSLTFLYRGFSYSRLVVFVFFVVNVLLTVNLRLAARHFQRWLRRNGLDRRRFLAVGINPLAQAMAGEALSDPGLGYTFVGYVNPGEEITALNPEGPVQPLELLEDAIIQTNASDVFLCIPEAEDHALMGIVTRCDAYQVRVRLASELFSVIAAREPGIEQVRDIPIIELRERRFGPLKQLAKRLVDIVVSAGLLILAAPAMAVIAVMIRRTSPGPAIFRQTRVGRGGREFTIFKFRSMFAHVPAYENTPERQDDPRVTPFGAFLRRTSLDELPQLFNVLKGEMSLVGPRPEMPFWVERYRPWERKRLEVPPGLTGMWQVHGRSDIPLQENIEYDLYYVRNQSLSLDLKILVKTIFVVLYGKGAY